MRMTLGILAFACLAIALSVSLVAAEEESDWKAFGEIGPPHKRGDRRSSGSEGDICFFDSKNIVRRADGNLRVWIKCLATKDMLRVLDRDVDHALAGRVKQKISSGYSPPVASMWRDTDPSAIIAMEQTADAYPIEPTGRIFYELNCQEQATQDLEAITTDGGSWFPPHEWHYAEPGTNNWRLLKLVCGADRSP